MGAEGAAMTNPGPVTVTLDAAPPGGPAPGVPGSFGPDELGSYDSAVRDKAEAGLARTLLEFVSELRREGDVSLLPDVRSLLPERDVARVGFALSVRLRP